MDWKLLETLRCKDGTRGHRLFALDGSAHLYIADNSGGTPDRCEDGALKVLSVELDLHSGITFRLNRGHTCDPLTEVNVRCVVRAARKYNLPMEYDWACDLMVKAIDAELKGTAKSSKE